MTSSASLPVSRQALAYAALQPGGNRVNRHHAGPHHSFFVVALHPLLGGQQAVQIPEAVFNRLFQFAGVRNCLQQPPADGVKFVVLFHFQRVELTLGDAVK